ncbi:helicase SRCAP-like isoform X3 [Bolinopsis microptera]|uniref:helicase SRCAP-like isoform X3 n=1 Tax=Bolinopsis microptera TaxID=2820187 RepID=UPI003079FE8D
MKRYVTTIPESSTKRPAYERDNLVNDLRNEIQKHQDNLRNHLAELFFLHNDGNLLDINLWTNQSNPFLENYIQQIKCASTDALPDLLEQVPTGHVMPKVEVKKEEHSSTPFMSSMAALSEGGVIEKAKHEALIVQQVAVLKQQGMWSLKRLPKVKEPDKIKCHWDYLLEEMQWLATDFSQERKWKKAAAKKQAYAVAKVFEEKEAAKRRQMVEQEKKLKKIAHNIAKDVMKMWSGVEKVHKFKQESHLEERRRKLMDTHLNIIVGQTEQFSSWLAQGLTKTPKSSVMLTPSSQDGDVEFKPATLDQPDDEETIAAAEEEGQSDVEEELADLKKQNEMDLNELIQTLPPGMLEKTGEGSSHSTDYNASDDTSADDEDTIAKAEADDDKGSDKADEIGELQHDQDVPLEELIARYVKKRDAMTESSGTGSGVSEEDSEEEEESEASDGEDADMELSTPSSAKEIDIELGKLCSGASEVEPSNKTSSSKSKLPFLLRGQLREYQEVGLQWLVAMEARKLNGILADEMGLGKTMQTIALLAHLACFKGIWGPHLIIVPTSVLLNWDLEFKKWLPSFKVMSYYGSQKERREKRVGWTKPNTFHVCVTSYKLVIQDYRAFRSKKWYFLILDEAHNIKNFKSQRWQLLLNFNSQRRLLLTGTPLQNNLMELWSLMHFLMPSVFGSQSAFREWFGNPLVGMVEGTEEYNAHLVERLHKILRPFLLRRLKKEVELQLPTKTESVLMCGLSKRQRALYEEFLSRKDTRDTLSSGRFISVIGILMQLRKVCNHPDLFEERGVFSPLALPSLQTNTPALLLNALRSNNHIDLDFFNFNLVDYEHSLSAHSAHRTQQIKAHRLLIEEVNYKGAVPDNVLYTAPSHSSFPPPRPPSPTLPPLPLLRQMPSLAPPRSTPPTSARSTPGAPTSSARSNPKSSPRPMSSPRSLPSPRSVHYTSPNPLSLSSPRSDSSEPPPLMAKQVTRNPETRETPVGSVSPQSPASSNLIPAGYFRDPVSGVMLPLVEPGMPPPRRPPLGPPQLTNYTSKGSSKRGAMLPPTLAHSSCSSPEPHALRTMSPRNTVETSPVKAERRSPDHADGCCNNSLALPSLEETRQAWRTSRRRMLADLNDMRCQRVPMYGADLISTVSVKFSSVQHKTVIERMEDLSPIIERFMICCDPISVSVNPISLKHMATTLIDQCHDLTDLYHPVRSKLQMIMPETRLIQYDCGKLQRLDRLLADLKVGDHRALIFTQMTKVLDILERFLNYHGYRYLRLDGTTRVDHRLELMERFNADSKIFCMILSTRSGGVGVNLTGADTVIFYDSDWNPTMDAQAQDRCHRIGQTRDVHIYRLISSCTIEENILKKANQKRLLGAVAIEEGNFTTAFFKKDNMAELFGNTIVEEDPSTASPKHRTISKKDLEQVLADAEDVEDRSAAQRATTEQSQDMCDFDEEVAIEGEPAMSEADKDIVAENKEFKQFEDEIKSIEDELTPLEQFALRFLEAENAENFSELLKQQEEELTVPDTSLHAMQAAQEEQGYQDDLLLTYSMWDPQDHEEEEVWPGHAVWRPPTPPPQDHDVYHLDPVLQAQYFTEYTMTDSELPEVTIIPNLTFQIIPPAVQIKDEPPEPPPPPPPQAVIIPPSPTEVIERQNSTPQSTPPLEEIPVPFVPKRSVTPDVKHPSTPFPKGKDRKISKRRPIRIKPEKSTEIDEQSHWLPAEEFALHQSILTVQELQVAPCAQPLDYNWNIISDILNISSNSFKTPTQCRERYTMMVQREEAATDPRRDPPGLAPQHKLTHKARVSADEASQSCTSNFIRLFSEIERLSGTKPVLEFRQQLTLSAITPNPTHNTFVDDGSSPLSAMELATKKKDRENKENKEKILSSNRREIERKNEYQIQQKMPGTMPPHSMPTQPYPLPRPKMDHMCGNIGPAGGPRAYPVMAPTGGPGVKHPQFYLLSTQRPIQTQSRTVNMPGGKPIMGQNKILVSAGQQPVKMQPSQHIGFMPGYMVNNNEEMVQQMKRPQYRPQQPGNHNNMIPLNMVPKPYIQNGGPYVAPIRGNVAKGVRAMGARGLPPQVMEEHSRLMSHQVVRGMSANHGNPMSPSPHRLASPPQVMQQIKRG